MRERERGRGEGRERERIQTEYLCPPNQRTDLCQVNSQLALLDGGVRGESKALDGGNHVLNQMLSHWVVHTVVMT